MQEDTISEATMLYLNPPYYVIRGVSVYPDHADPLLYHYLPAVPRLSTTVDAATGLRVPQLGLLKFTGEAGSGGFLTFGVDLGIDERILDEIRAELRQLNRLHDLPRLAPVMVEDGRVRLMILGKETPEPTTGAPAQPPAPVEPGDLPKFVTKISHYAKPALYGDNQAIFSVQLDQYGATLIEESLKGQLMPVGVVYSLDFFGLRPAYHVKVTADWDRVQTHFEEAFSVNILFVSVDIDTVVDKLIEDRVIIIEVDTFVPEGEEAYSGALGRRDQAIAEVKDMVLGTFFEPSLDPAKSGRDGWDRFSDTVNRLGTGGSSFGYKKIDMTRIDKKRLNVNMSERTTVRRSIYPQANLQGLFTVLRDSAGQIDLGRFVTPVNLDHDFFRKRTVNPLNRVDMAHDSIQAIHVTMRYGSEPKSVILDPTKQSGSVHWTSILDQAGHMVRDVHTSYRVVFKGVDTSERPGVLESPEKVLTGDDLEIDPHGDGLYHIKDVKIVALSFPWATYPHVEVNLRYSDPAHGIDVKDGFLLDKDHTELTWPLFLRDLARDTFEYQLVFRSANNRDRMQDWTASDGDLMIRDPFPRKRKVMVVPAVSWDVVSMIFVNLSYQDADHGVSEEASFMFDGTADGKVPKTFAVDLEDPSRQLVAYQIKMLLTDNSLLELPPSVTLAKELIVRVDLKGHRVIAIRPEAAAFAPRNVAELRVGLTYRDEGAGLSYANTFTFKSPDDEAFFEFDYADSQKNIYSYQVTTLYRDGFVVTRDPAQSSLDALVIPVK